ncbi:MAG: hypothetical protein ACD_13C00144G0067 [uncultured bacterium]|nr:MAG: hypothetical protein ACD_13C00144G0067 [uncultured bacterium]KKR52768.1 MAG: hypothetical protein UT88_C0022G0014 [Candidatus Woesebacteria bacterium GW2011_GWD2_40_19]KKR56894.1 MAG: hypothetical protein UT96_C0031G0021 [Candidatus Woesebacteria bacterium GW2011_GWC2_40_30]HAU65361.1 hypothetical protein [Candidatus Woesebacteria bacterium]HCC09104.1 hypothetical protein [Candidatus Woesebacteria bacterium]
MKKTLPIIVGALVLVVLVVGFVIKGKNKASNTSENDDISNVPVLSESEWPAISLTPTNKSGISGSDGHWLNFKVEKINVSGAASMDYLMVYSTSDGGQQGVPGTVKLTDTSIERMLLLGSESSGKFRYDAGVEQGTMTITFRDGNGKMIGKLTTDFHLQSGVTELTSVDGIFKYTLDKIAKNVYFVTMKTYKEPSVAPVVWQNGYGVFASDGLAHTGELGQ